jgi:hypothetical protein
MFVDFIMLSEVHFIIAAEAGDTAKAETTAAAIKNLIQTSLGKWTPAIGRPTRYGFPTADVSGRRQFLCCGAKAGFFGRAIAADR